LQELIGAEIIDETDRWTSNTQTARVNAATLTEELPSNLRTLVALGLFMPRVHPTRSRTPSNLTSSGFEHASFPGTPAAAKAVDTALPSPAADGLPGTSIVRNVADDGLASQRSPAQSMRAGVRSETALPTLSTIGSEGMPEAARMVEEEAVSVPQHAAACSALNRRTTSIPSNSSFLLAKMGRGQAMHTKERAAQVVLQASDSGASS
jgi:hypothetical protein